MTKLKRGILLGMALHHFKKRTSASLGQMSFTDTPQVLLHVREKHCLVHQTIWITDPNLKGAFMGSTRRRIRTRN